MVMMIILMVMCDGGNMLVFSLILACFTAQQWTKLTSLAIQDEFLMHNLLAYLNLFLRFGKTMRGSRLIDRKAV
jgi:hypothetical protein